MIALGKAIPDADVLLAMEPEEIAAKLLFIIRLENLGKFCPRNLRLEFLHYRHQYPYPASKLGEIDALVAEAFAWLDAQGLIIPDIDQEQWRRLGRRAKNFEDETDVSKFIAARQVPKNRLHSVLRNKVWAALMRGEYDVAVFQAMKAVEVAVRAAVPEALKKEIGVPLMRKAFDKSNGPLADMSAEEGEREMRAHLFAGAIGSYKNTHSHRDVHLDDPAEAIEIILLANHLLRIVDARAAASTS